MKEFKYKTVFSSVIKPIISKEKNLQLAKASLEQLRQFIPNVDIEANYDLLPVAFPLFNVNYFNKNDDGVDTAFALQIYKSFINKFIDLNHKRTNILGCILSAHITEFGTDKPLTEEDVKNTKDVFNITVGGVLWRAVNEDLTDLIEESNNILDENYDKIKASFEVGFSDLKLVKCPANSRSLAEGTIIDDPKEVNKLTQKLKAFGGTGQLEDGSRIYRLLAGEGIGLGGAVTESPAAFINAIAVPKDTSEATTFIGGGEKSHVDNASDPGYSKFIGEKDAAKDLSEAILRVGESAKDTSVELEGLIGVIAQNQNKISQSENQVVIQDKNLKLRKNMKFTKIQDITDETLKEATASSVVEFVETELKAASEKYAKEKLEKESVASELQKKHDELVKNQEQLVKDLEILKANLQKLEQEKLARETQATFNTRMASFEDKYTLTEDELSVVGSQIKDLNDEQYKKTEASLSILLKGKSKSTIKQEVVASETTKTETQVVDKALDGAQKTSKEIAATSSVQTPTLKEKYAKAFSQDQFVISK